MTSKSIYPYVYKVLDKETGEFYIGSRHRNVTLGLTPEEDFLIHYFTSGSFESKLRDNPSNFECSIIFRSGEPEVAYWYEQLLIRENIKNPLCMNGYYIDPDTESKVFSRFGPHSEETRQKMSKSHTGKSLKNETKHKMSEAAKNRQTVICPHCGKSGKINMMKRWHLDNCRSI